MEQEVKVETVETQNPQEVETTTETIETEEVVEAKKANPIEVLRELSKQYSVDLFKEGGLESLKSKWQENEKLLTTTKTDLDLLTKENENFSKVEESYKVQIEALGMGFSKDNLEEVMALAKVHAKDNPIQEGLKIVKEKYANVFISKKKIGLQHNDMESDKPDIAKNEQEQYLANSKAYQAYNRNKK